MAQRRSNAGIVYWVVSRNEDTTERVDCRSFTDYKEADLYRFGHEETADPPGIQCVVKIETLLPGEYPPQFLK